MKMNFLKKMFLIVLCVKVAIADFEKLDKTCQKFGDKFKGFESEHESNLILKDAFAKGLFIKKTKLEVLKYVHFPDHEPEFVLVRRTLKKNFDLKQLKVIYTMGHKKVGPAVYGCQHGKEGSDKDEYVYIVKEPLFRVLEYSSTRAFFRSSKRSEVLKLYADIFSDLEVLHGLGQSGQIHNNVSPLTLFTNAQVTNTYLTGYNMMQTKAEKMQDAGVPLVMAPTRFQKSLHPSSQDDWYSVALLVANMESKHNYDDVFTADHESEEFKPISLDCLKGEWTEECQKQLADNVTRILKNAGYGEFLPDKKLLNHEDEMNLTTLLTHMIHHDDNMSQKRVSDTLKRLIKEAEENQEDTPRVSNQEERDTLVEEFEISANNFNELLEEIQGVLKDFTEGKEFTGQDPRIEISQRLQTLVWEDIKGFKQTKLFAACPELFFRRKTSANVRDNYEGDSLPSSLDGVYEDQKELEVSIKNSIQHSSGKKISESEAHKSLAKNILTSTQKNSSQKHGVSSSLKKSIEESLKNSSKLLPKDSHTSSKNLNVSLQSKSVPLSSNKSNMISVKDNSTASIKKESVSVSLKKDVSNSLKKDVSSSLKKNTQSGIQSNSNTSSKIHVESKKRILI